MPRNSAAGNRFNFGIFVGSDGFWTGKTFVRPAVGTSTNGGAFRLQGAKQATPTVPTPSPVLATAEDGFLRHEYPFPSDASRGFEIQLGEQDLLIAMQVQNMPTKSYAGGKMGYVDIQDVLLPNAALIFQSWAIDSVTGVKKWSGVFIPVASLAYLDRDSFNERTPGLFRYFATPQPSAYDVGGYTIFDNDGTAKPATYMPFQDFNYPVTMHAYTGNAIATVFPTDLQPAPYSVLQPSVMGVTERVDQPITSVQTSTPYGVTFTSAPTANGGIGGRGHLFYQFR